MKPLKRHTKIMLIVLSAVVLAVLVLVANVVRSRSQVKGIEVMIRYGDTPQLVEQQAVKDTVLQRMPNLLQLSVKNVDCQRVAAIARRVPYLANVSASVSVGGKVVVRADQRRPIMRLYYGNREFYMDSDGAIFPPSTTGYCDVLVAGGNFTEPLRRDSLNAQTVALWKVASFLDGENEYGPLIDQIFIERDGDIMSWARPMILMPNSPTSSLSTAKVCPAPVGTPIPESALSSRGKLFVRKNKSKYE